MSDQLEAELAEAKQQATERLHQIDAALTSRYGKVEIRKAAAVEVRWPDRQIELVAVPYEEPTEVLYGNRIISERFARGAFEGIQTRNHQFPVNRAHDRERPIGWVGKFQPRDQRGLVARVDIVDNVRDGDEALALAAEGLLGASVGFGIMPGGETWSADRQDRTITKAWLDHIALTGSPAYDGAKVLAVRADGDDTAPRVRQVTPNIDEIRLWQLQARYSHLQP